MLYFVIHVLSSYHIVHGIPSFSFHYRITHAAPHFIYTRNLTCFEFPALPGWVCAFQLIKKAIRFTPMFAYLLTFCCRCTLPENVIFFIAHSLLNCHSSFCYHVIHCFVIYTQMHFTSLKQLTFYCRCTLPDPKLEPRPCWVNEGDIWWPLWFLGSLLEGTTEVRLGLGPYRVSSVGLRMTSGTEFWCQQTELDLSTVVFFFL